MKGATLKKLLAGAGKTFALANPEIGKELTGKVRMPRKASSLEAKFLRLWTMAQGPILTPEFRFHPTRKWRLDFALPDRKFGIEIEGLVPGGKGRHQSIGGAQEDATKYLEAWILGWDLIRLTSRQITADQVARILLRLELQ